MGKKIVIVGGGHNGLVCACYLARAGAKVTILEKREIVGGAAITEEFHPGFKNSVASYTVSLLHPKIIADLHLNSHGLRILERKISNYLPLADGDALISYPELERTQAEVARFSSKDASQLANYYQYLNEIVPVIKEVLLMTPPAVIHGGVGDLMQVFKLSRLFRRLNNRQKRFMLRLFSVSAGELLDDIFESEPIKALLGFDSIVGHYASPYSPGSAYVLLHHVLGEVNGKQGVWGHAVGGMGAITQAMQKEAIDLGVEILTGADVDNIEIAPGSGSGTHKGKREGKARAVHLSSGEVHQADVVVANVNPKLLFLELMDKEVLSPDLLSHFETYKCQSGTFRMNVALSRLPDFTARGTAQCLEAGIIMATSLAYMDEAFNTARKKGWSDKPIVEMLIPSTVDPTLAPPGQHVASLFCQHFDPKLGKEWDKLRELAADTIINTVDQYAPGFRDSILARQIHSPWDLEKKFGLVGGDIFHGRLSLDQLFSARPMLGIGQYQTEIKNLFMCGAGTHPGGGVSGIPGHNSAREILRRI